MFEDPQVQPDSEAVTVKDSDINPQGENLAEGLGASDNIPQSHQEPEEEEKFDPVTGQAVPATVEIRNPYALPEDEAEQPENEEVEEVVEDTQTDEYTLLVFMCASNSREDVKVTIEFNQESRNRVNYRMPVTSFSEVVCPRKNKLSLIFAKTRLEQDWGPYEDFKVYINGVDP